MQLYPFQQQVLDDTKDMNRVAYYYDMGLGKTFIGSEKLVQLGASVNLVVCQKSKIDDWVEHFEKNYQCLVSDLTIKKQFEMFLLKSEDRMKNRSVLYPVVGIINYDLIYRRKDLAKLKDFTLLLDESSVIQNESSKRATFILDKLQPKNVILLSGTPVGGKYENLWSQLHLLGWKISKDLYWKQYVDTEYLDNEGYPVKVVKGYKNVERLKDKMNRYGCRFKKSDEVFDLPDQNFIRVKVDVTKEYRKFRKDRVIKLEHWEKDERFVLAELVGDTTLTKMLYERQLCGQYNDGKFKALKDLLESTDDRVIIFYNFTEELYKIEDICYDLDKPVSIVNGQEKDLTMYEEYDNSVTCIQYQAGAMGLNLQKSNKIIYFTPTLSSELFEQSKKRIHRIGQKRPCFYYQLVCKGSVEENIYKTLEQRKDYTDALFEKGI